MFTMDNLIKTMIGISHDMSHDLRLFKETSCSKLNLNFISFLSFPILGALQRDAQAIDFLSFQIVALFFNLANIGCFFFLFS